MAWLKKFYKRFSILAALVALILSGFGCKNITQTPPSAQVPSGWKEYRNADRDLRFAYPNLWEAREKNGSSSEFTVYVDDKFPSNTEGTDFVPDITVSVVRKPIAELLKGYAKDEQLPNLEIGKISWLRYRYYSDLLSENVMLYIQKFNNAVVVVEAPESIVRKPEFYDILNNLEVN